VLAPECVMASDGYYPFPTDIWSLGITLFAYVDGGIPFYNENELEMELDAQKKELEVPEHFSKPLAELLHAMLSKDPIKRPTISQVKNSAWFK